jgi:hypothetical protein
MALRLPRLGAAVLVALLAAPTGAKAAYRLGIGEQVPPMFASPAWQSLHIRLTRYIVAWDWTATGEQAAVAAYMEAARAHGQDVLVTFTAHRGCFDGVRYSRAPVCRPPSASAYRAAVRAFDDRYPWVRTYSAWNEVNHVSQPTFGRPQLAARYYSVLLRESRRRHFRVMAADVLDTSTMCSYLRAFLRLAPGRPRLWGCTTTRTSTASRPATPGRCWRPCPARSG